MFTFFTGALNCDAATLITTLRDKQRKGLSLALSSSGSLAAVTDSLGRISLIDVQALVVVRLWKVVFQIMMIDVFGSRTGCVLKCPRFALLLCTN